MSSDTKQPVFYKLGLIGYPLTHSRSPALHAAALRSVGLNGEYGLYSIPPMPEGRPALDELIEQLRCGELHGLNTTIPHKQVVLVYANRLTEAARIIGAVNTLIPRDGQLLGDNTDAPGFLADVEALLGDHSPGQALVIGAGGSARAAVYGLLVRGWDVTIAARRLEQAEDLAEHYFNQMEIAPVRLQTCLLTEEGLARQSCDLLVNTTPVGMYPKVEDCPWPLNLPLAGAAAVYDMVYNPLETRLVVRAREEGLRAASGLGMLVEQGALSFEYWTGQRPLRSPMYEAVRKEL